MATVNYFPVAAGGTVNVTAGTGITGDGSVGTPLAGIASSASVPGTMSAANFSKMLNMPAGSPSWAYTQYAWLVGTAAPAPINSWIWVKCGDAIATTLDANMIDANVEGGGCAVGAGNTALFGTQSLFKTCNTGNFVLSFYGKIAAPLSGKTTGFGLINTGQTLVPAEVTTAFASNTTKYLLREVDGGGANIGTLSGSGVTADGSMHWFTLTGDATTLKMYVGTTLGATDVMTHVTDVACVPFITNTDAQAVQVLGYFAGFVLPT